MCTISKRKSQSLKTCSEVHSLKRFYQKSYLHARVRAECQPVLNNKKKVVRCLGKIEWEFLLSLIDLRLCEAFLYLLRYMASLPSLDYSLLSCPSAGGIFENRGAKRT